MSMSTAQAGHVKQQNFHGTSAPSLCVLFESICENLKTLERAASPGVALQRVRRSLALSLQVPERDAAAHAEALCQRYLMMQISDHLAENRTSVEGSAEVKAAIKAILQLARVSRRGDAGMQLTDALTRMAA